MGFCGLFFMGFFWVCGGIYGGEGVMQLAPTGLVFASLLLIMGTYALPIALINAELAVAIPEDGGLVVWVQQAFGSAVGGHNSWWVWASYIFDAAIYPVLAASYLTNALGIETTHPNYQLIIIGLAEAAVVLVTLMKLCGPDVVVKFATLASIVSLAPAFVFVVWGFATVPLKPERWVRMDSGHEGSAAIGSSSGSWGEVESTQWELLFSWMLWLNSGYLGLGALAAGVDNPKRTFPLIVVTLIPFVACVIIAPFLVSLSVDDALNHYEAGYFSDLAEKVAGPWLKDCFVRKSAWFFTGVLVTESLRPHARLRRPWERSCAWSHCTPTRSSPRRCPCSTLSRSASRRCSCHPPPIRPPSSTAARRVSNAGCSTTRKAARPRHTSCSTVWWRPCWCCSRTRSSSSLP